MYECLQSSQCKDFGLGGEGALQFGTTCHKLKQVKQNATNNLAPFLGQLLMLFQMVCSILLTVLHLKTLLLIGCKISTANRNPSNNWFLMATQRAKWSLPSERALKADLKSGVRLFLAFCLN